MKFGSIPVTQAQGAILAHSLRHGDLKLRKGIWLGADEVAQLQSAGIGEVIAAVLDDGDLHEDVAARQLAAALVPDAAGAGLRITAPVTGRVNLLADGPGIVALDVAAIEAFNRVHPMITIATVPQHQQMSQGGMVATIKIISFAVPSDAVDQACDAAREAIHLTPPVYSTAALIVTEIPGGPDNTKGIAAIQGRLEALGLTLKELETVPHDPNALAQAISKTTADMVLILTGSATMDTTDVAPLSVGLAGGRVERFGMPVDPGNLLFLGALGARPVIGLPGCARSPALNGADWVLSRVACGHDLSGGDIAAMGVGGLLKEIPTRPQPRASRRSKSE